MRSFVEEHDPAILGRPFVAARAGDVHDLVVAEAALFGDGGGALAGVDREDAPLGTRRVSEPAEGEEEDRAEEDPRGIEPPEHAAIIRAVTRAEIEEQLIAIVRQEKNVADELLKPGTSLAEAGIDSLDSLTILFAIEEHFRISIPDDEARAVKTFDDLIDIIAKRVS
jgi:acyl carrier protein